jgi:hypothetical protein
LLLGVGLLQLKIQLLGLVVGVLVDFAPVQDYLLQPERHTLLLLEVVVQQV